MSNSSSIIYRIIDGSPHSKDISQRKYDWLQSEYSGLTWNIRDPENPSSPITETLSFDGPLIGGGRLSEIEGLMDDLKQSLVLAVEFSIFKKHAKIRSCSAMRHHLNALKRVFNEIYDMDGFCWSEWTRGKSQILIERLKNKPSVSQSYLPRLKAYINNVGVANLPVRSSKSINKINYDVVYDAIGINRFHAQRNPNIQEYWDRVYEMYNDQLPLKKLRRDKRESRTTAYQKTLSRDYYHDILRATELYQEQTYLLPNQFVNASMIKLIGDSYEALNLSNLKPANGSRTRNIPVPLFLKLVDASIRYILDYSEALFDAEKILAEKHECYTKRLGNYLAGKEVNGIAREMGVLAEGRYSPFPLAAYKHYQAREEKISQKDLSDLCSLLDTGLSPKQVRDRLGLSKGQFDYRSKRARKIHNYSRDVPHTGVSLQKALYQFLPLSCLVVIFAFSARRESEVFGMTTDCYKKFYDGWRVKFYVAKSRRRHEWFTSVPVVIKAIEMLERLSESGRQVSNSDSLFCFDDTFNRSPINMDRLNIAMESFLDFIGVEKSEGGERFKFSEHQFRRFFAVMYFYRYEKQADLEALTYELRHEDWSNTAVYLTEQECGRIFREVEKEFMAEKLVGMLGAEGETRGVLRDLSDRIKQTIDVVPENRSVIAMKYIEENSLRMDFISEGICFGNTPRRSELSKCYSDGYVMCHRASEEMCDGCPNLLPVENIKNDRSVAAMQTPECDSSSILEAAIKLSMNDRKVEG
ncbi:hypothetical protein [Aurantivibrio plasticivorans]